MEFNAIIARMIKRHLQQLTAERLGQFPAVALLGPRQVGKTTLAQTIAEQYPSIYLDLEAPSDRAKLSEPSLYLSSHEDKLVILDEVQRIPDIFQVLRGLIDSGRKRGLATRRFLLLGSASIELLQQSGESLAGRINYIELPPLGLQEVGAGQCEQLWLRGGFPDSFLAANDQASFVWRESFIRTYLERDIPLLGPRVPAETLRRFWTMLAHQQGALINAAQIARSLAVDGKTVARYLDLLVDLLLVRRLLPWHNNVKKRLVKSPKVYVRDSGITHALLGLIDNEQLLGHPVVGASWEGFVIENILSVAPASTEAYFYRTLAGAEMDLLLKMPGNELWGIEIKRNLTPKLSKGFYHASADLPLTQSFVIYPGQESYPLNDNVNAINLRQLMELLVKMTTG